MSSPKLFSLLPALVLPGAVLAATTAGAATSNWTFKADITLKEAFDSNVYLQDVEPSPTIPNAVRPFQESFVTSVTPRLALDWKPIPGFNLAASYAPEVVTYHAEPSESHVTHRVALTFSGKVGIVQWEQYNTFNYIDGSDEGLTFGGPGGAPAIGGICIRDRREALVYRNGFRAFHPHGDWFFRPVAWSYVHDFRTVQKNDPGYQNYVDRNDFTVGIDVGYKAFKEAHLIAGYRFGFQQEPSLPWSPIHYSNKYHRFLVGFEGKVADWLKIIGAIGPDVRNFDDTTAPGFDNHYTCLYYDASIVATPSKQDTITILLRQYQQPAFGAPSVYDDITWDVSWRHKFNAKFTTTAGFRAYEGDWLPPVQRDDWIFTPSCVLSYVHDEHLSGELGYFYDWSESLVPNTGGREYSRHRVSLGVKYAF